MATVIEIQNGKSEVCNRILRSLPNWFGIEGAIVNYVREVASLPMFGTISEDGNVLAFLSLNFHNKYNAEVHVMGVLPDQHGRGHGTALIAEAERYARENGRHYLTVKTLSPSKHDPGYDKTQQFYLSVGFVPLEEFKTLWGEHNPCLLMIKSI